MNQFMMNQFAAAAAVNNKNNGLEGLGFAQQGMINPQTLMYQNQLMYQVTYIPHIKSLIYISFEIYYNFDKNNLGSPGSCNCCILDSATTTTPGAIAATSASAADCLAQHPRKAQQHHRSLGATFATAVWRRAKIRQERQCQCSHVKKVAK